MGLSLACHNQADPSDYEEPLAWLQMVPRLLSLPSEGPHHEPLVTEYTMSVTYVRNTYFFLVILKLLGEILLIKQKKKHTSHMLVNKMCFSHNKDYVRENISKRKKK